MTSLVSSLNLFMGAFEVKKLGRSVIDITIPQTTEQTAGQFFQRVSIGSGIDDRAVSDSKEKEDEKNYRLLSKINKTFQQKSLLMTLESSTCGELYKLDRINLAASLESTLPCTSSFNSGTVRSSTLSAGGLMKEWDL
jgi:hypothetical protein